MNKKPGPYQKRMLSEFGFEFLENEWVREWVDSDGHKVKDTFVGFGGPGGNTLYVHRAIQLNQPIKYINIKTKVKAEL